MQGELLNITCSGKVFGSLLLGLSHFDEQASLTFKTFFSFLYYSGIRKYNGRMIKTDLTLSTFQLYHNFERKICCKMEKFIPKTGLVFQTIFNGFVDEC